ncbi:MAG: hypothetical protein JWR00_1366 [Rubritepida sp.]|jgi:hypothetical protein|nr:hypothetical protein [Rubritepida sp.]
MPLPTPKQLDDLLKTLIAEIAKNKTYGEFNKVKSELKKLLKMGAIVGAQTALQSGVTFGAAQAGVASGLALGVVTLAPLGAALGPWLSALAIVRQADGIFALHDLRDFASGKRQGVYKCTCGKCATGLQYVIDKKENNVAILALAPFTAGLSAIVDRINSVRKSFQKNRPKEQHSRQFVASAKGGCVSAMVAIMLICGKWPADKPADPDLVLDAIAILLADDGWAHLKSKW